MEEYLRKPNLPDFLKPISPPTTFMNLNLSDPDKYNDLNYKYHQYFANLNNNVSFESTFYPTDSFSYYKTHKVYRPILNYNPYNKHEKDEFINNSKLNNNQDSFLLFDSFVNIPTLFSDEDINGISYHTAVDMPDGIYLFGGLLALSTKEYEKRLKFITKNFTIPPENIKLVCDYDLPLPLDKEKIESIALKPYSRMSKFLTESKSIRFVCNLYDEQLDDEFIENPDPDSDKFKDYKFSINNKKPNNLKLKAFAAATSSNANSNSNTLSNSSIFLNACPKSLICSSASKLSDRFFMIYGGLEIDTKISFPDNQNCIIEKILTPNDQFWLFDRIKCHFREIKLSVHPTYSSIFPNSIPRFGHSVSSIPIDESYLNSTKHTLFDHNNDINNIKNINLNASYTKPAVVFVMGGYKLNHTGKSFISMNDLWKIDIFLDSNGTADEAVASPIGNFNVTNDLISYVIDENMNQLQIRSDIPKFTGVFNHSNKKHNWPSPRGFFSMCLVDAKELSQYLDWKSLDKSENGELKEIPEKKNSRTSSVNSRNNIKVEEPKLNVPIPKKSSQLNEITKNSEADTKTNNPTSILKVKSDFKIKDLFKNPTSRSAPSKMNRNQSSQSSINTIISKSRSPYSEDFLHTNTNEILSNKILVVSGGSSILYTKVVNDEIFDIFYNNTIHDDIWIFDFQTEKWYNFKDLFKFKETLSICGHSMFVSGSSLKFYGGIKEYNYDDDVFQMKQAGVYGETELNDKVRTQKINWEEGIQIAQKFHRLLKSDSKPFNEIVDDNGMCKNNQFYNYYVDHEFRLESMDWRLIKVLIFQDLKFFDSWDPKSNSKVVCGGMVDEFTVKERKNLINKKIIYTLCPSFIKDSKIVMFSPDVKVIDKNTNKCIPGKQRMVGNGVSEIFSVYL